MISCYKEKSTLLSEAFNLKAKELLNLYYVIKGWNIKFREVILF